MFSTRALRTCTLTPFLWAGLLGAATLSSPPVARAEAQSAGQLPAISADEARAIATDAYIFGYPLVTMEMTRRVMTNVEEPKGTHAPMGQLVRMREYPSASFRDVTAPNADTLYTTAWMDVSEEPWVLSIPASGDRYFLMPMLDGWTNIFQVPGKRTTGNGAQTYLITGPGWQGSVPSGMTQYKSPTGMVWLLGRIYCAGTPEDYAAVHAMQDKVHIYPLSAHGKAFTPPKGVVNNTIDMKTPVREQVNSMEITAYFDLLAELMKRNPPAAADAPMMAKLARIGIIPGVNFDINRLEPAAAAAVREAHEPALKKIMGHFKQAGADENGWLFTTNAGVYGTDYLQRAFITAIGLGANRPQDAIYPTSEADAMGKPYSGANKYVMRFEKGKLPPVDGFWSLTMYDAGMFFVANPLNRFTLSARDKLKANPDGSVDLYIQHENPGPDKQSNWLPAPAGKFNLMLRLYWPKETPPSLIDGSWKIPPVKKVD